MFHIHAVHIPPSLGAEASSPVTTWQGDQIKEPANSTGDAYFSEHNSMSFRDEATVRSLRFPCSQAPHSTTEYSADSGNRTQRARVSLHVQKLKPQASLKNLIKKCHKLFNVYNTIHKIMGVRQLRWQCYCCHQQNT